MVWPYSFQCFQCLKTTVDGAKGNTLILQHAEKTTHIAKRGARKRTVEDATIGAYQKKVGESTIEANQALLCAMAPSVKMDGAALLGDPRPPSSLHKKDLPFRR